MRTPPHPRTTANHGIQGLSPLACTLLKETIMRPHLMLVFPLLTAACVEVPHAQYFEHDAGTADAGSATPTCSSPQLVSGDLTISSTSDFTNIPATCWQLGGKLTINSASVTSLAMLGKLTSVSDLELGTTGLTKVDAGMTIAVSGDVYVHDNASLTDLSGVAAGTTRIGSLVVTNNAVLTNLGGLSEVQAVTDVTTITDNPKLTTLDLHAAQRLEGGLDVETNAAMTSIDLSSLTSSGAFTVKNNAVLTGISLGALQYVHGGGMLIDTNAQLDLSGMTSTIEQIDGFLQITNNPKLTHLGQLAHAVTVGSTMNLSNNQTLNHCTAREVGCCVAHQGTASTSGDPGNDGDCPNHSWCWNGGCPYSYQ